MALRIIVLPIHKASIGGHRMAATFVQVVMLVYKSRKG